MLILLKRYHREPRSNEPFNGVSIHLGRLVVDSALMKTGTKSQCMEINGTMHWGLKSKQLPSFQIRRRRREGKQDTTVDEETRTVFRLY